MQENKKEKILFFVVLYLYFFIHVKKPSVDGLIHNAMRLNFVARYYRTLLLYQHNH